MAPRQLKLTRREAADYLQSLGYRIAPATLASMVTRGGGPAYGLFGNIALYEAEALVRWAESRLTPARGSDLGNAA